jgi:hypothetical protein
VLEALFSNAIYIKCYYFKDACELKWQLRFISFMTTLVIATIFSSSDTVSLTSVIIYCMIVMTLNMLSRDELPVHGAITDLSTLLCSLMSHCCQNNTTDWML